MKTPHCFAIVAVLLLAVPLAVASEDSVVTAVYSSVSNGYTRTKLPNGSFKRETYAISNGGYSPGIGRDASIDAMKFPAIAGVVAQYLAKQNYFLAQDAKSAELLLVISWGKTVPLDDGPYRNMQDHTLAAMNLVKLSTPSVPQERSADGIQSPAQAVNDAARNSLEGSLFEMQMFNSMRQRANEKNARLLGYMSEINSRNNMSRFAGAGSAYDDLIGDLETERYYVIISAYDFRAANLEKKQKLLWSTRVSVQAQGNRFDQQLIAMMNNASRQFGQNSGQLIRQYQRTPRIELGELKSLGFEPAKQN